MKILHLPFTYHPDPVGGTEVYVGALVRHLAQLGITGAVAAPWTRDASGVYEHEGTRVHRFPAPPVTDLRAIYGRGSSAAAGAFRSVIDAERPDLVHMHAFTHATSSLAAATVRRCGLPLVFTYHTPTVSCQRGNLLRYGRVPCDGEILITRCSACLAQQHGAGPASWAFAMIPPMVGRLIAGTGSEGRGAAAFRLTELMTWRKGAFAQLAACATIVVAVSEWVRELLLRNGVPASKIVLNRQGTDVASVTRPNRSRAAGSPLRAIVLARMDPAKGLGMLVDALALAPTLGCQVHVYGVDQGGGGSYAQRVRGLIERDPRIRLLPAFPGERAAEVIAGYDVTLVPSQGLETGPLVVLESFAAGVPVVGSRLGGIAERVRHEVDGLLVTPTDTRAWADVLSRLVSDPEVLARLRDGISAPRTMAEVATEMRVVYDRARAASASNVELNLGAAG